MKRLFVLMLGVSTYVMFLGVFLYAIGFVGNFLTPTRLDGPASLPIAEAVGIDLLLLSLFAIQHSTMARPWFKQRWTRVVPEPMERSVYVLASNVAMLALFALWQPISGTIWTVQSHAGQVALYSLFAIGWLTVLYTTFLINHFDLFGLRQVWLYFRKKPYTPLAFATPGPYRFVRHPMYIGWILAFWATPTMTVAHFTFAVATTSYILVAIYFEERDLVRFLGQDYAEYRQRVPMLIPRIVSQTADSVTTKEMLPPTGTSVSDSVVSLSKQVN